MIIVNPSHPALSSFGLSGRNRTEVFLGATDFMNECPPSGSDKANEPDFEVDSLCTAVPLCVAKSGDHRKVVSHIFGRNKACTSQIPRDCWIYYCRKHYQRHRFRARNTGWKSTQFDIIRRQINRLELWGGVIDWQITLRKKERENLAAEDEKYAIDGTPRTCRERFLLPYLGHRKTYGDIRTLLQAIETEVTRTGADDLPGFELLPNIDKELYPPTSACKRAKVTPEEGTPPKPKQVRKKRTKSAAHGTENSVAGAERPTKRRHLVQRCKIQKATDVSKNVVTLLHSPNPSFQPIHKSPRQRRFSVRTTRINGRHVSRREVQNVAVKARRDDVADGS